ncbi:3-deoxy-7-phosphoheptulonate synthase class II [Campylobacter canadensis]|uniref:Phospho-2-dehydro-3-deoxyheptonate aldolase n=1 Tax=Campylobacter canadensis TaxID=449520 RepID=A0ABS7WS14_9BACT|nr:3-deoxy-7-phosphoheptulonate synthase class II [Campylobacter canadensis]MBZ7987551.1 3-deoxy-7-phosphoheptulonate synthase [Campylobacter canadensis]MBZ7994896.1 3-deoxy-7-phosphoheptulonate synthase [Campylobacter canadensis]MBZ7996717.1 3-deoxy-7-phosphoheptulonate synthase [Campylobacter canadensis]MBZ7998693.1 3-deoxy-7-phosphoheptulonate synthase [Campylobacter canadensis]MBZ8000313.1 3-deoxy-7-phosphoheptulonate synthase [Campylobacter canadensis]
MFFDYTKYNAAQQPEYENKEELQEVIKELSSYPPLIFAMEANELKKDLAKVCKGEAFLLQGGDCAESFNDFNANNIRDMFKLFLQMALVLSFGSGKQVVKIARMAGQFAKPRSSDYEEKNNIKLPSYRGDIINSCEFNDFARKADAKRMLKAYLQSAATLNLLRAFSVGGLADLALINKLNLGFVRRDDIDSKYESLCHKVNEAIKFFESYGISSKNDSRLHETKIYTSHEALLLPYETALTRKDSLSDNYYNCSAHMLWIGERTRNVNDAHVQMLSRVCNPIGVKIGANANSSDILKLCEVLNPNNEAGRLNIIFRMGANKISNLEHILKDLSKEGLNLVYSIDPMHGNTQSIDGYKTRKFDDILQEVKSFWHIAKVNNIIPGGVHFEMTGQNVTECLGGSVNIKSTDLQKRYETQCDPRLNADQALELAFLIAELMNEK